MILRGPSAAGWGAYPLRHRSNAPLYLLFNFQALLGGVVFFASRLLVDATCRCHATSASASCSCRRTSLTHQEYTLHIYQVTPRVWVDALLVVPALMFQAIRPDLCSQLFELVANHARSLALSKKRLAPNHHRGTNAVTHHPSLPLLSGREHHRVNRTNPLVDPQKYNKPPSTPPRPSRD